MSLSSFFSSFLPTVHADAPEEKEETKPEEAPADAKEEPAKEEPAEEEPAAEEEEEEEEPEDVYPAIREECQQSAKCISATKHFQQCEERVNGGQGFHGENCVEEFMMHCVDNCTAPKVFATLK